MTHPSKNKGNCYERELVQQAIDSGLSAKRAYASNGESLGHTAEVDLLVGEKRVQAKRRKTLPVWIIDAMRDVDAAVMRPDRGQSIVVLTWWEYLDLLKASEGKQ